MKLKKLKIKNFKGLTNLEVNFSQKTIISGRNATGKTSVMDAYFWLLFGKNAENQKDFGVKPYDNGNEIHNLDVEVEGIFDLFTLKRVLKEKWQKKRGSDIPEFVGNETEYYIDGIKVSQSKFQEFVLSELISEDKFKAYSIPLYAPSSLHWTELRRLILEIIKENEIESALLIKYGIQKDKFQIKEIKESLRRDFNSIKNKLVEYPIRISELESTKPEACDWAYIEKAIAVIDNELKKLDNSIIAIEQQEKQQNDAYWAAKKQLSDLENTLRTKEFELKQANNSNSEAYRAKLIEFSNLSKRFEQINAEIELKNKEIAQLQQQLEQLRNEYKIENSKTFQIESEICSFCGQQLPEAKLIELKTNGEAQFNEQKRKNIELITQKGQLIKQKIEQLQKEIDQLNSEKNSIELIEPKEPETIHTTSEIEKLRKQISEFKLPEFHEIDKSEIQQKKNKLSAEKNELMIKLSKRDEINRINERITQLKSEWQLNADRLDEIEKKLINIEKFEIELAQTIEQEANKLDDVLKFKTYRQLINGGIEPCFEIMMGGVLFNDLNHSGKILIGMKLIEILRNYSNYPEVPIWVDNAEAINELPEVNCQLVALYVSEEKYLTFKNY